MNEKLKYWDDFLNPVLVKEMRQFFHNKVFLTLVAGLLGLQLLMLFIFNLTFSQWKDSGEAGTVFVVIDTILMYLCILVAAVWNPMQQFAMERSSKELDFSNITLLTPWQIISGKLASSLVVSGLIASLCLPFMTVAYFFRNVTLTEIFLIFGAGIMPALVLIQGALFCGTIGKKWVFGLFIYFACQVVGPGAFISLIPIFESAFTKGPLKIFWCFQLGWGLLFALLLAATVAMVTPPFANKMLPLRILLTLSLLPVLVLLFFAKLPTAANLLISNIAGGLVAAFALLAACDRDEPGGRVLAQVPANPVGRFFHALFSSNRRGGMVLGLIMLLFFGAITLLLGFDGKRMILPMAFGTAGYIFVYAEIAIWINRRIPSLPGWAALPVVAFTLGVLPLIAATNIDIRVSEIIISPLSLFENMHSALDPAVWLAPMTAWLLGIFFVVDMISHYKYYKAPDKEEFEKEYENHDPHL